MKTLDDFFPTTRGQEIHIPDAMPSPDCHIQFCDDVYDTNAIHRDKERAKSLGFPNTPIAGTYLVSKAVFQARKLIRAQYNPQGIREIINGGDINFSLPAFPEEPLTWVMQKGKDIGTGVIDIKLLRNTELLLRGRAIIAPHYLGEQATSAPEAIGDLVYATCFDISEEKKQRLKAVAGNDIDNSEYCALTPSALLRLMSDLNVRHGEERQGLNKQMSYCVGTYHVGDRLRAEVYHVKDSERELRKINRWKFDFVVILKDEKTNASIVFSRNTCLTDGWLDVRSLNPERTRVV